MISGQPNSTVPISSTSQMFLTHNGEIVRVTLNIQTSDPITLSLDS